MSDLEGDEPKYPCGVCGQDLNHPCYNVLTHPLFGSVPLCVLCHEELEGEQGDEDDDWCAWCGSEGLLYVCSDVTCERSYCEE